jgi:hypothetical protein
MKKENHVLLLLMDALKEAHIAMGRYPLPNPTTLKIAEESGEVIKECMKISQGKGSMSNLSLEIRQSIAMLIRLAVEGDETLGVPSIFITKPENKSGGVVCTFSPTESSKTTK